MRIPPRFVQARIWCSRAGVEPLTDGTSERRLRELVAEGTGAQLSPRVDDELRQSRTLRRSAALAVNALRVLPPRSAAYAILGVRHGASVAVDVFAEPDDAAVSRYAALLDRPVGQVRRVQATGRRRTGNTARRAD